MRTVFTRSGVRPPSIESQVAQQQVSFYLSYALLVGLFLFTMQLMRLFVPALGAAAVVLIGMIALAAARPAMTLGLTIGLTIIGDPVAMAWWPVAKNMSSFESILYVADAATVKPLELLLIVIIVVFFVSRRLSPGAPPLTAGPMGPVLALFTATMIWGFVWGMMQGGDFRVAIFEITPLLYIPMVYLAAINLFTTTEHYRRLLVGIAVALLLEVIHGIAVLGSIRARINEDQSPLEHTAVLHLNLLFLFFVGTLWFGTRREGKLGLLLLAILPAFYLFLDAQRRAGVVALILGGIVFAIILFIRDRAKFFRTIPVILLVTALYSGAFWNSENQFAFPAQAVKTIVQPDAASEKDTSSDLYREIETFNLNATIRSSPVLGIGFGQRFLQPIPLPDISFFEFSPYIPHNSVLWMWTKVGIVGFLAFLFMIARGTAETVRAAVRAKDPDDATMIATFGAYLPMLLVLAYVEIAFDATTAILFAISLALADSVRRFEKETDADADDTEGAGTEAAGETAGDVGRLAAGSR